MNSATPCPISQNLSQQLALAKPRRVLVAYSGGLDSSVLLHAVCQLKLTIPVCAIHVHHGLSSHADAWLEHCQARCDGYQRELFAHKVDLPRPSRGQVAGLEQAARQARYEVFTQHLQAGDVLLMAHHQDDQVETFMMRLMRGSGLTGLSAMEVSRELGKGRLWRPLLGNSRAQIEHYAAQHGVDHVEDESNGDTHFDRNWWRHALLPQIQARFPQSAQSVLKTIEVLQAEHALLNDLLEPVYQTLVDNQGCLINTKLSEQSWSIQCQIVRKWQERHGCYPLLADKQIRSVITDVLAARQDAEPIFKWQGNEIRRHNGKLYCMSSLPVIPRNVFPRAFNGTSLPPLPLGKLEQGIGLGLKPGQYQLALYAGNAKAKPINRPNKSLKKWFQEYAIPPWQRPYWPVLWQEERAGQERQVVAVPGLFVCQGFACEQGWQLNFKP
ncbi:MAG: tRNA lysidine(34) synthetase TilS [Bermanella sp.]